jgi:hypothetical protein
MAFWEHYGVASGRRSCYAFVMKKITKVLTITCAKGSVEKVQAEVEASESFLHSIFPGSIRGRFLYPNLQQLLRFELGRDVDAGVDGARYHFSHIAPEDGSFVLARGPQPKPLHARPIPA